uniref:MULTIHEME_CYTC domain-containing protein n=1 Tax=Meloidogyne hapla TaxID=6305 RepID=A0A1I8C2E9_MELHA
MWLNLLIFFLLINYALFIPNNLKNKNKRENEGASNNIVENKESDEQNDSETELIPNNHFGINDLEESIKLIENERKKQKKEENKQNLEESYVNLIKNNNNQIEEQEQNNETSTNNFEKWNKIIQKLETDEQKNFEVSIDGIHCKSCHKPNKTKLRTTDEEKWNTVVGQLNDDEKLNFKVDKNGIKCLLCHKNDERIKSMLSSALNIHINSLAHQHKIGKDVNIKSLKNATEEKCKYCIDKLEEDEKEYFYFDKKGINCLLCHKPEKRVSYKKFYYSKGNHVNTNIHKINKENHLKLSKEEKSSFLLSQKNKM